MPTKIEWCDETINPMVGCSKISDGCVNCYAQRMAMRLAAMGQEKYRDICRWDGLLGYDETVLDKIDSWKTPKIIFITSMGDPFHDGADWKFLSDMMRRLMKNDMHVYILLTKRAENMNAFVNWFCDTSRLKALPKHIWLGVTVEHEKYVDRCRSLVSTRAFIKFVSCEPLLGPVDLRQWMNPVPWFDNVRDDEMNEGWPMRQIDWVICGGETGQHARRMDRSWAIQIQKHCSSHSIPFFFKHNGVYDNEGNRVGKKRAGNTLMLKTYREYPHEYYSLKAYRDLPDSSERKKNI